MKAMNSDLIKNFSEQAHEWAKCASWSTNPKYGDKKFEDLYNERFAELIIEECARVQRMRSIERHGYDKHLDSFAIEKHFGVI